MEVNLSILCIGYYGGANVELMMLELVHHGPFTVGLMFEGDFFFYSSGIYHQTDIVRFNPFVVSKCYLSRFKKSYSLSDLIPFNEVKMT